MGFGSSYSLVEVDCIDWVKTSLKKRLIRTFLGALIAIGMYSFFKLIAFSENPVTSYVANQLIASFIIPFVIYGPFLVLCKRLRLVEDRETILSR
jgi:ABC-type Co2+ transport system permease subunit